MATIAASIPGPIWHNSPPNPPESNGGSEPARDGGLTVAIDIDWTGFIAGKPAPTGIRGGQKDLLTLATTVALHTSSKPQLLAHWLFDRLVST